MKASEMTEGESYALQIPNRDRCARVTVLSKQRAGQGKVQVRVDEGVEDYTEAEVSCSRIVSTWRAYSGDNVLLMDTLAFAGVAWLPKVDEEVECDDTFGIRWTVQEVSLKAGWVVLSTTLMSRRQVRTVAIDRLRPAAAEAVPSAEELDSHFAQFGPAPLRYERDDPDLPGPADEVEPARITPVRRSGGGIEPQRVASRFIFGPTACLQYRRLEPRCRRGDEPKRMRPEVRKRGGIRRVKPWDRKHKANEYLRYQVPGRFEVVLFESPSTTEGDIYVERIELLKRRRRGRPRQNPKRRR
jgi:hypothetical protein